MTRGKIVAGLRRVAAGVIRWVVSAEILAAFVLAWGVSLGFVITTAYYRYTGTMPIDLGTILEAMDADDARALMWAMFAPFIVWVPLNIVGEWLADLIDPEPIDACDGCCVPEARRPVKAM